jgi:hypothetical protein
MCRFAFHSHVQHSRVCTHLNAMACMVSRSSHDRNAQQVWLSSAKAERRAFHCKAEGSRPGHDRVLTQGVN